MKKVNIPNCEKGAWKVEKFTTDRVDFSSLLSGRNVPLNETYTKLTRNGVLIMSDTPAEMSDCVAPLINAKGSCLINGLGLGMILKNVLLKTEVTDVTIVEISQDLIDLISPHYKDVRITYICEDAFKYNIPKGKKYQMVWHDIWDNICVDNLPEMTKLHKKYCKKTEWQGSWCKRECLRGR